MIQGDSQLNTIEERQMNSHLKDFQMGQKIKKVTTHDLFYIRKNNSNYVVKTFKPQFRHNFDLQLNILRQLKQQNIVQLIYYLSPNSQTIGLWQFDMLIFKDAQHGSLNDYIPLNGKLPQSIARVIFKQIIAGLKYAANKEPNGIIHPNLLPSSILLDSQRKVKICGWSKVSQKKQKKELVKNLLFNCCQILILMLTSYMPFFKKNSAVDPLFKFLKPGLINKFWQNFEKRIATKYKTFQFSNEVKQLIQKVFLQEWTTFKQVEQSSWMKGDIASNQQYNKFLSQIQKNSRQIRQNNLKKHLQKEQKKRQILLQYEESTLRGSSQRSSGQHQFFIQQFYDNLYPQKDVPALQCSELIRLYDNRPSFVIASLKDHLRKSQENQIAMIFGEDYRLSNFNTEIHDNEAYLTLKIQQFSFGSNQQQEKEDVQLRVKAIIKFMKNSQNDLFAQIKIIESNLSQYYVNLIKQKDWAHDNDINYRVKCYYQQIRYDFQCIKY